MSRPLRILHVDSARTWRGGQRQVLELIQGQRDRGDEPSLACPEGSPLGARVRATSSPVYGVPMRGTWDLDSVVRIAALTRRLRPHIAHWHTARAHALGAFAALLAPGSCRILARRIHLPVRGSPGSRLLYALPLDAIVAISEAVRRSLIESGVDASKIEVIPSGIDLAPFEASFDRPAVRRRLGIDPGHRLVLFAGFLSREKAPDLFIEAAALVHRRDPGIRFWLAGDGTLRASLEARIRDLRLGGAVRLLGFRENLVDLFRSADLFCLPSRVEGLGSSILDAMAAGVPTIASRVGGIPELVADGGTGTLVAPGDVPGLAEAILSLARDPERCRVYGERAREAVRPFSSKRTEALTRALYDRVIESRGSSWERWV